MDSNKQHDTQQQQSASKPEPGGTATGAALSDKELVDVSERDRSLAQDASATQNVLSDARKADPAHTEETTPGSFGPFRYYVNQNIRNRAEPIKIGHAAKDWHLQELTIDAQLRLANPDGDDFVMVPLDERYIPDFLAQL